MSTDYSQATRAMLVSTPLGADKLLLVGFEGTEQISGLYSFRLDLIATNSTKIDFDKLLGEGIIVAVRLPDENADSNEPKYRYISGICSSFSQGNRDKEFTSYQAEIAPHFWLATRMMQSRMFQQMSVPEILKKIFQDMGMKADYQLDGDFEKREYCVQYHETDFNFASRLMEEEGIFYFFKHSAEGHMMIVANSPRVHTDVPGPTKMRWDVVEGRAREGCHVHEWVKRQEVRSGKVTMLDHSFELPGRSLRISKSTLGSVAVGGVNQKLGVAGNERLEIYEYPGDYAKRFDGVNKGGGEQSEEVQKIFHDNARTAEIMMQAETVAGLRIEGTSNCPHFTTGHKFSLDRHFDAQGNYVLTSVHHTARGGNAYRSGMDEPFVYSNRFVCIPINLPFRPQRITPRPRVMGAQSAVVVGPPGEEIFTDKYGRVKVQFPWDRNSTADADSSCWLRVCTSWAGKQWGAIQIPRIGHEVIVQFLEGDPDRPIIVGSVYNAGAMPPYELPKHKTVSAVKSRSSKDASGHNELRFEDKKGSEQVVLHSQGRMDICANSVICETNGGDRNLHVGCDWSIKVKSDLLKWIVGGVYQEIDKDFDLVVTGKVFQKFDQTYTLGVKEALQVTAQKLLVAIQEAIDVQSPKITIEAPNSLSLRGGEAILEGGKDGLTLRCGDNFIKITPDGIKINGMAVKMLGATIDIEGGMINLGPGGPAGEGPAGRNTPDAAKEDGTLPDEAAGCACGPPGSGGSGSGGASGGWGQKHRRNVSIDPLPIPHWVPPPPPKLPIIPPTTDDSSKTPCEIKDLTVQCEHASPKPRTPDPSSHLLQIVPSTNALSDGPSFEIKSIKCKVSTKRTKGGTDALKFKATSVDGKDGDLKIAIIRTSTPPVKSDYKSGSTQSFNVSSPACSDWWPFPFTPDSYYAYGLGCKDDATPASVTVEAYPSITYSGNIECTKFEDLFGKWKAESDQLYGFKASFVLKSGFKGKFEVKWGWEENSDWRACFSVSGKASCTFITATGKLSENLRDLALAGALQFAGVPFNATMKFLDKIDKLLEKLGEKRKDIDELLGILMLTVGIEISLGLEGAFKKKFFPSGGSEGSPSLALKGNGRIFAELKMVKNMLSIVCTTLTGKAEGPIEATGDLSIETDGLYMSPALDFKGAALTVEFTFRVLGLPEFKKELLNWKFMDPKRIWPDPSDPLPTKWKLIPPW